MTLVEANTHITGLPANCCDAIVLRRVYHHLSDPAATNADFYVHAAGYCASGYRLSTNAGLAVAAASRQLNFIITCKSYLTRDNYDDYSRCCLSSLNHVGIRMVSLLPWIERQWSFTAPVGTFPAVLERLVGTPARAAALVAGVPEIVLAKRSNGKWSAKEHFGHASDLHALDMQRVDEFLAGAEVLSAADMTNRRTDEGNHGATSIAPTAGAPRAASTPHA